MGWIGGGGGHGGLKEGHRRSRVHAPDKEARRGLWPGISGPLSERRMREEGEVADMRAWVLSESDARAGDAGENAAPTGGAGQSGRATRAGLGARQRWLASGAGGSDAEGEGVARAGGSVRAGPPGMEGSGPGKAGPQGWVVGLG